MLSKSQSELIEYIYAQGTTSSGAIATRLQVSKRTVISYVKDINSSFSGPELIRSNNRGYYLDLGVFAQLQGAHPELFAYAPTERIPLILQKLLGGYGDKIDINSISAELHYSTSTIRSDLYRIREVIQNYGLDLQLDHNSAVLTGPEQKKREFYCSMFQDTLERNIYDFSQLTILFSQYNITRFYFLFTHVLEEWRVIASDYKLVNIFYRMIISVDRVAHGHLLDTPLYLRFVRRQDSALSQALADTLSKACGIPFPNEEIAYLSMLFAAMNIHSGVDERITAQTLKENLWPECYTLVEKIVDTICQVYDVDLRQEEEDYVDFALHIRSLIRRLHAGIRAKNPYRKSIKQENPAAFDAAVYAAGELKSLYPVVDISDDDIAYLALCLGHSFEAAFDSEVKLNALFVLPTYYNVHQVLYDYYSNQLKNYINPHRTSDLTTYGDLDEIDIVISTLHLKRLEEKRFVQIGPIRSVRDQRRLYQAINELHHEKLLENVQALLRSTVSEKRFYHVSGDISSQEQVLEYMLVPLLKEKIVTPEFKDAILRREALSSTAASQIALPRTPEYAAAQDTVSILLSDTPISWGRHEVRAVILLTSKEGHYNSVGLKLLRRFSHIIGRKSALKNLLLCKNAREFCSLLY